MVCEFCLKHGEGKKWYLQTKNYAEEFLNENLKKFLTDHWETLEETLVPVIATMDRLMAAPRDKPATAEPATAEPATAEAAPPPRQEEQRIQIGAQIIPIEDAENILDLTVSIARIPCLCRSALHGIYDRRFCYVFAAFKSDFWPKGMFEQFPDLSREFEVLTKEEAKKELWKLDRQGLVHTIFSYGVPFVANICNCGPKDCLAWQPAEYGGRPYFYFKSEYIATVDTEKCNGCRDCVKFCNFGAIQYSPASDKCTINQLKCSGCGLCRVECARDAITLWDRNAIPALAKDW